MEGRTSWQVIEMDRRLEEEARERHREAEEGKVGLLHPMYTGLALKWFQFMADPDIDAPSVNVLSAHLSCQFSLHMFLQEFMDKLSKVCTDCTHRLYQQTSAQEFVQFKAPPQKRKESDEGTSILPLPGSEQTFILIGRNVHQWRYSLDSSSLNEPLQPPILTNPKSQKSFQQFDPLDMTHGLDRGTHPSGLAGLKLSSQALKLVVPRQRMLLLHANNTQINVYIYNWSNDMLSAVDKLFQRLVIWHNTRAHFVDCLVSQKMGLYQHCYFGSHQKDNPFTRSLESIDSLVKQPTLPSRDFTTRSSHSASSVRPTHMRKLHPALPPFDQTLQNVRLKRPLQGSPFMLLNDPVLRNGAQFYEVCRNTSKELEVQKELENLYVTWEIQKKGQRSKHIKCVINDDTLELLKQRSRIVHYCATPLLFHPAWRRHVMADHDIGTRSKCEVNDHGNFVRNDAPWHSDLKNSLVSQYMHFLNTLGFTTIETSPHHLRQGAKHLRGTVDPNHPRKLSLKRPAQSGVEGHLHVTSPGGIILIELSFRHTYFCVKLYAFESSRVPAGKTINKQLATRFTDDCIKFKDLIDLHSFAYDFHLRTMQAYLVNPDMGFKNHYHVAAFLSCFTRHYTKPPHYMQIKKDTIQFLSLNTPAPQLYDYLVNHPPPNWRRLLMYRDRSLSIPASSASSTPDQLLPSDRREGDGEEDQALCMMTTVQPLFHDRFWNRYGDDLEVGVVVAWDRLEYRCGGTRPNSPGTGTGSASSSSTPTESGALQHKNMLQLEYYVIVTSRKEWFPMRPLNPKVPLPVHPRQPSTAMQREKLVENESSATRERIRTMLTSADINCRRDTLWDQLLMWGAEDMESVAMAAASAASKKSKKRDSTEEDDSQMKMSYPEFKVLLGYVHHMPLTRLDPSLVSLLHNSVGWYADLFRSLQASRYPIITRYVTSEDRKITHLVLLLANSCQQVVLFTVDETAQLVELELISKEQPNIPTDDAGNESILLDVETQKHIENLINAIGFHLWTTVF